MTDDNLARAINAASCAAANTVYEYASRYGRREDYEPLEELAERVQRAAVEAGAQNREGRQAVTGRLLTARELGEELGVTAETVLRWTRAGDLPAVRLPGTARGRLRYRRADVEAWLERHATAGDGAEEVSPAPDAARQAGVSSVLSPVPLQTSAARTEEN